VPTALWCDLASVEWLIRKIGQNLQMPPATWLVSRELTHAAGSWDTRLSFDDDGEYFSRVVLASDAIRFVPEAKAFYRVSGSGSLSDFDQSPGKLASLFLSMQLHIGYLRALEESERTRAACLNYLQRRFFRFYPEQTTACNNPRWPIADSAITLEVLPHAKAAWLDANQAGSATL